VTYVTGRCDITLPRSPPSAVSCRSTRRRRMALLRVPCGSICRWPLRCGFAALMLDDQLKETQRTSP